MVKFAFLKKGKFPIWARLHYQFYKKYLVQ